MDRLKNMMPFCVQQFVQCVMGPASPLICVLTLLGCLSVPPPSLGQPIRPNIFIDNVNGLAEGLASGAPEALTPIIPPNQCATTGASNTINSVGHGLGGVPTDGSAAVWMNTPSGPRWCVLTGVPTADTFTVQCTATPNISPAVDCVVGGRLVGPLGSLNISTTRGLCPDFEQGWTITIVNTGTTYIETNTVGCPMRTNNVAGGIASQGRQVLQGSDPSNPTPIEVQFDGDYIRGLTGSLSTKIQHLEIIRNAAGSTGHPFTIGFSTDQGTMAKNMAVRQTQGIWDRPFNRGGRPAILMSSQFHGPFDIECQIGSDMLAINNFYDGCSGTADAISETEPPFVFNILDNKGAAFRNIDGDALVGYGGMALYNTFIDTGGDGIRMGTAPATLVSGNYFEEASTLGGACFNGATGAENTLGGTAGGSPTNLWRGNAARTCPTARYAGGLDTTTEGQATDINAGASFDIQFQNAGIQNFFPDNADAKSDLVFPGTTFPFQTPAAPVSTMTVGAAQRFGQGGVTAYAF